MEFFDPFTQKFWLTVGVAILCGVIIGIERQLRGKPAGVRTSILVCLGTTIFIHLGAAVATDGGDPSRVLAQVVTGVGFLGAGVMFSNGGVVSGVTTAAVIWMLAAIGAAIGLEYYVGAITLSVLIVFMLIGVEALEASVKGFSRGAHRRPDE